jgi:hypothetical protein
MRMPEARFLFAPGSREEPQLQLFHSRNVWMLLTITSKSLPQIAFSVPDSLNVPNWNTFTQLATLSIGHSRLTPTTRSANLRPRLPLRTRTQSRIRIAR